MYEWEWYFTKLLEGRKEVVAGTQKKDRQTLPEETEITAEEVER
jgi:hypothetical protein